MAVLRSRFAYIIVAVLRSTALRRVVEYTHGPHHTPFGEMSSSLHPGLNTVRPRPSDCGRCVLTPGSPSSAQLHSSPHLWCVALRSWKKQASREVLTGRSTSSPDRCLIFGPSPDIRQCRMVSSPGNSGPNIFEHTCG